MTKIQDEFTGRYTARQRLLLRRKRDGVCGQCGAPRERSDVTWCNSCLAKEKERQCLR